MKAESAMKLKIAIAGLGAAGRKIHLPAYGRLPDLEVLGGFDPSARKGDFPFPLFSSAGELLERTRPDLFAIATPPDSHYELIRLGLSHGCHVLCEKPFTTTLEEATEVVLLSRSSRRWVVVNNQFRFMNVHRAAKERIGTPEFGELLFLDAQQTFFTSPETEAGWRGRDTRRACKEFGIHVLDLCRFFFDEDPVAVTARMPKGRHPEGPDYLNLIQLEFSQDRVASIVLDRLSRGRNRYLDLRLDGSAGSVETHLGGGVELCAGIRGGTRRPFLSFEVYPGGWARLYQGERLRSLATDPLDLFVHATQRLLQAFLEALARGTTPPCHAEDNRRTLALMLAAYESAESRQTVEMSY